jgi:hypothetical protein
MKSPFYFPDNLFWLKESDLFVWHALHSTQGFNETEFGAFSKNLCKKSKLRRCEVLPGNQLGIT